MQSPKGSRALIRAMNRTAVLNALREHGALTQPALAKLSGLSPATISAITVDLLREGWIRPAGSTGTGLRGGRPGTLLSLDPTGRLAVGVKVLDDRAEVVLVGLTGEVVEATTLMLPPPGSVTVEQWIDELVAGLESVLAMAGSPVLGVGIGVTGQVDSAGVVAGSWLFPDHPELPLGRLLADRLSVPVHLENDVTTLVVAEQWFGAGRGENTFAVVTVGRGVGAGLVLNGRLHRGVGGAAGELGHLVIDPDGAPCYCGRRGCLETLAADPALQRAADRSGIDLHDEAAAHDLLADSGTTIGRSVAWLVTLTAPDLIVLTGEGLSVDGARVTALAAAIRENCHPALAERVRIVHEPMTFSAWAVGAARVVLGEVFAPPAEGRDPSPVVQPHSMLVHPHPHKEKQP